MYDPYAGFQKVVLPNGLEIHAAHWPDRPWERARIVVFSGAKDDLVGLEGTAHFLEHMVTPKRDARDFFEDVGGSNNGATGFRDTSYPFSIPLEKLGEALAMYGERLFSSNWKVEVENERRVITAEFHRKFRAQVATDMNWRERKMLYGDCWLGRFISPLGAPESIARISHADLDSFRAEHYVPANMAVVAVGGATLPELVQIISESPFGALVEGHRNPPLLPEVVSPPPLENRYVFEVSKHIVMEEKTKDGGYHSLARLPGILAPEAVAFLASMLDYVLEDEIRQKRSWTYSIGPAWQNNQQFYEFGIECRSFSQSVLDEFETVVELCLASLVDREDLFERVRQRELAEVLMRDQIAEKICNHAANDLVKYQRIISFAEDLEKIKRVKFEQVMEVLHWLRPEQRWTVIRKP